MKDLFVLRLMSIDELKRPQHLNHTLIRILETETDFWLD